MNGGQILNCQLAIQDLTLNEFVDRSWNRDALCPPHPKLAQRRIRALFYEMIRNVGPAPTPRIVCCNDSDKVSIANRGSLEVSQLFQLPTTQLRGKHDLHSTFHLRKNIVRFHLWQAEGVIVN